MAAKWTLTQPACAHQKDTTFCGILVMENARCILRGQLVEGTDVSLSGIKVLRRRIASELAAGI